MTDDVEETQALLEGKQLCPSCQEWKKHFPHEAAVRNGIVSFQCRDCVREGVRQSLARILEQARKRGEG